jgi:hypothetical protein
MISYSYSPFLLFDYGLFLFSFLTLIMEIILLIVRGRKITISKITVSKSKIVRGNEMNSLR